MTLQEQFASLSAKGEKALVLFVTAGDPPLDQLPAIIDALQDGGVDIIEVGLPFSDPIADGPTIQAASQRALDRGVTPTGAIEAVGSSNRKVPLVAMGYLNPLMRLGLVQSAEKLKASGFAGTIISDIIPEEAAEWIAASKSSNLNNIFLAAPTSTDARLKAVCKSSTGFVYAVARLGVTGAETVAQGDGKELVLRVKGFTDLPVCAGFGISTPDQVKRVCEFADGAVIGSALVTLLAEEWQAGKGRQKVIDQVAKWKAATR